MHQISKYKLDEMDYNSWLSSCNLHSCSNFLEKNPTIFPNIVQPYVRH